MKNQIFPSLYGKNILDIYLRKSAGHTDWINMNML
jgi:hypothetical protein